MLNTGQLRLWIRQHRGLVDELTGISSLYWAELPVFGNRRNLYLTGLAFNISNRSDSSRDNDRRTPG